MSTPQNLSISPQDCTLQLHFPESYDIQQIARPFIIKAKHPTIRGDIGHISGTFINRNLCRGRFLGVMDAESDELHQFSMKLFDKNGMVRPEIVDHEHHKGSGAWGREVNDGTLVYVDEVMVQNPHRRAGVGSWMLQQLFQSQHVKPTDFVFVWPVMTEVSPTTPRSMRREQTDRAIRFFRKNGFRRVGKTQFFGYALVPTHPSRAIPATEDAEGYPRPLDAEEYDQYVDEQDPEVKGQMDEALQAKCALHFAIGASSAPEHLPVGLIPANILQNIPPIRETIIRKFRENPESIHVQDESGMTPLHIAAGFGNVEAVETLLSPELTAGSPPDLDKRDNTDGRTPLECLEADIRSTREFTDAILDEDPVGASDGQMRCVWTLKKAMGEDVGQLNEFIRQNKWGCTCGQCMDGWFSPQMRFRLKFAAGQTGVIMQDLRPSFDGGEPVPVLDFIFTPGMDGLPPSLQNRMTARVYDAYRLQFDTIFDLCVDPRCIPTTTAIFNRSKVGALGYYTEGGRAEYALEAVLRAAQEQSPVGDGEFDRFADDIKGWKELPKCANNLEFKLVRVKLGLPKDVAVRPPVGDSGEDEVMGEYDELEDELEDEEDEEGSEESDGEM